MGVLLTHLCHPGHCQGVYHTTIQYGAKLTEEGVELIIFQAALQLILFALNKVSVHVVVCSIVQHRLAQQSNYTCRRLFFGHYHPAWALCALALLQSGPRTHSESNLAFGTEYNLQK